MSHNLENPFRRRDRQPRLTKKEGENPLDTSELLRQQNSLVKIVTDSTSDIPSDLARELEITVIPLQVNFGDQTFRDLVDISRDDFYKRFEKSTILPTTSQPAFGVMLEVYGRLAAAGRSVLGIHLSSHISGTYNSCVSAVNDLGSDRIAVLDSRQVSLATGFQVVEVALAAREGQSLEELVGVLKDVRSRSKIMAVFDTLEYLQKGGRIGKARALAGAMMSIKPIMTLRDGEPTIVESVRVKEKAVNRMIELAKQAAPFDHVAVLHANNYTQAEEITKQLGEVFPRDKIIINDVTPVIGVYVGPQALGIAYVKTK